MQRLIFLFSFFVFVLVGNASKVWTINNLPISYLQDSSQYVCDPDNLLKESEKKQINEVLATLEQKKGVESIIVVVNSIEGGDCYEFILRLVQKYGVGNKKNNSGLGFVLSLKDRCYYTVTGSGLEGILTDAQTHQIQKKYLLPSIKKNEIGLGILNMLRAYQLVIEGDMTLSSSKKEAEREKPNFFLGVIVLFFFLTTMYLYVKKKQVVCPNCKKGTLRKTYEQSFTDVRGRRKKRITYQCTNCNYVCIKDEDNENNNRGNNSLFWTLPFILNGTGRGRGYGSSGGSFGGGHFGGGGSGGNF